MNDRTGREKNVSVITDYITLALQFIKSEIEAFYLALEHPQQFIEKQDSFSSPPFWSKEFHATALSEELFGYQLVGAFETADGRKASDTLVFKCFEQFFNVKLGVPSNSKRQALQRKTKLTEFTDLKRNAIIKHYENIKTVNQSHTINIYTYVQLPVLMFLNFAP